MAVETRPSFMTGPVRAHADARAPRAELIRDGNLVRDRRAPDAAHAVLVEAEGRGAHAADDLTLMAPYQRGVPFEPGQWSSVTADTIVIDGGKSPTWMRNGNKAGADAIPGAEYKTLSGQTHNVKAKALTPALLEFFS
jgi:hypothetical protein